MALAPNMSLHGPVGSQLSYFVSSELNGKSAPFQPDVPVIVRAIVLPPFYNWDGFLARERCGY